MRHEPDCCGTCPCGTTVHLDGVWPPNACSHGLAACDETCAAESCDDCAKDAA